MTEDIFSGEKQLVVFHLAEEAYGLDIATVREIIQMQDITKVPGAPHSVEGVINLRGVVVPVIDLRSRFGLNAIQHGKETRIVVVNSRGQDIGIIVDSVAEVLRVKGDAIASPSQLIKSRDTEYMLGIVKLPTELIILLDADRVLNGEDEGSLSHLTSSEKVNDPNDKPTRTKGKSNNSNKKETILI